MITLPGYSLHAVAHMGARLAVFDSNDDAVSTVVQLNVILIL